MAHEEEICTRISESVKMAGFLEKKGKMKIVSAWKKYWFVLEERLLLYYRSQIEYINLSPCRGSLNMGLVTTVRPGSSTGPCIIHVITRTQVVQLRAKNRSTQEEWLQALLDSMSLPIFNKTLKTPLIADLHGHRYSMDNIPSHDRLRKTESERSDRFRRGLDYRKKEMSGSFYGGSLDTVVWSKKFKTARSPSPNIPKGKMLEKILGYVEEGDSKSTSDMVSLIDDDASSSSPSLGMKKVCLEESDKKEVVEDDEEDLEEEDGSSSVSDKDENKNRKLSANRKSTSNNELNSDIMKGRTKEELSQLEKIKNAMRKTRDKAFKSKTDSLDRKPSTIKKRRQSFLHKVFKRHYRVENDKDGRGEESGADDPLYDTIENVKEQKESLISSATSDSSHEPVRELPKEGEDEEQETEPCADSHLTYTHVQRPVIFGSKSILSAQAMSELKTKLKSREGLEVVDNSEFGVPTQSGDGDVPELPPRRHNTRPKSPWHDVPVNNTPVHLSEPSNFNMQHAEVKFHHDVSSSLYPGQMIQSVEAKETDTGVTVQMDEEHRTNKGKDNNNLTVLLEQLTEIATGSLTESVTLRSNGKSDDDELWQTPRLERRLSDPDYDIPRPHKPVNLCISSEEGDKIGEIHYATGSRGEDTSDTSLSFHSIEPDSLESAEKKIIKI